MHVERGCYKLYCEPSLQHVNAYDLAPDRKDNIPVGLVMQDIYFLLCMLFSLDIDRHHSKESLQCCNETQNDRNRTGRTQKTAGQTKET